MNQEETLGSIERSVEKTNEMIADNTKQTNALIEQTEKRISARIEENENRTRILIAESEERIVAVANILLSVSLSSENHNLKDPSTIEYLTKKFAKAAGESPDILQRRQVPSFKTLQTLPKVDAATLKEEYKSGIGTEDDSSIKVFSSDGQVIGCQRV